MIPLLRRGKRCLFSLSLYLLKRERVYFYSRGNEKKRQILPNKYKKGKVTCVQKSHLSSFQILLFFFWSSKNCLISQILLPFNSSKPLQSSLLRLNRQVSRGARRSSSSASSFAERERERERENVVGKFVEEKRFTLNAAAAKTTKLELGNLSFCLLTHHHFINIISLKPKNVGGEDDERGSSSSTSSARTVSRVSANAFYGSEHDE